MTEQASEIDSQAVKVALHVISTERATLTHVESLYTSDRIARNSLSESTTIISETSRRRGKLIVTGIGKSGKIGQKLVATFNSLGVQSCFLHPTEALHGDLGLVKPNDAVLMLTSSGRTPELLLLLPHIRLDIHLLVLTSCSVPSSCEILRLRPTSIFLPAPVHEPEQISFGLSAPTSTAIAALAVGHGLALAVADRLYTSSHNSPARVFHGNHPGGALKLPAPKL
jgi:D-arabinose 5-phosphate isomerase GutQ